MDERIRNFLGGDRAAGESLLSERLPRIRNIVRSLLGSNEVDDVSQQVMVEVIRSLSTYRAESPLQGWVDRITVRVALRHARRRRRTLNQQREQAELMQPLNEAAHRHPERELHERRALELLDRLPTEQRAALVLHHMLGLSVKEVAAEEATAVETVRSRLRLGLEKLRSWTDPPERATQQGAHR